MLKRKYFVDIFEQSCQLYTCNRFWRCSHSVDYIGIYNHLIQTDILTLYKSSFLFKMTLTLILSTGTCTMSCQHVDHNLKNANGVICIYCTRV